LSRGKVIALVVAALLAVGGIASGLVLAQRGGRGNAANPSGTGSQLTTPSVTSTSGSTDDTSGTPGTSSAAAPAALQQCRAEIRAEEGLVKVMATAIGHLGKHIQAMRDNWTGRISVDEMKAMWKMTRLAGPSDLAAYKRSSSAVTSAGHPCAALVPARLAVSFRKQAGECQSRSATLASTAAEGVPAVNKWSYHLQQMAAFKAGAFDAATADRRWLAVYDATPPLLQHFDHAMSKLARAPACG
jgi:antitoxin (DNA-binding transcriptional repressor) of toxin-antitoxin stability system